MSSDRTAWLALRLCPGLTRRRLRALIEVCGAPAAILTESPERLALLLADRQEGLADLTSGRALKRAEAAEREARRRGFELLTPADVGYPERLHNSHDPPIVLWVYGSLPACAGPAVAVVGSRRSSEQGRAVARHLASGLAEAGVTVVSGLARGIDGAAHQGALDSDGTTLAVLGSSVDVIYPWQHRRLARRVARSGAILSEYALGTEPRPWHFPERNRLIVGLVSHVVVVEASARSGALITARLAAEEGRDVLAVPGPPWDDLHAGTNALIQDGAKLVQGLPDVLEELSIATPARRCAQPDRQLSDKERRVLESLSPDEALGVEAIARRTGLAVAEVLGVMSRLELAECVVAPSGGGWLRLAPGAVMA